MNTVSTTWWLGIAAILSASIAISIKAATYYRSSMRLFIGIGIVFSLLLLVPFYYLFQTNLGTSYAIIKISSVILAVIAGLWMFGERLDGYRIAGVGLGCVAIYLMTR